MYNTLKYIKAYQKLSEVLVKLTLIVNVDTSFFRLTPPPPHLPKFSKILPFLEILDVPTFHRPIEKIKVQNNSCNQFIYNLCPQSILILEECLQKW